MRGSFRSSAVAVLVACGLLVAATTAGATGTPSRDANAVAAAIPAARMSHRAPAIPAAGMSIGPASFLAIPPAGNPTGVSDTPIAPFPADGPTYAVLSTGDATLSDQGDQAGSRASAADGAAAPPAARGDTARDVTVLAIPISVPAGANCLSFDFRFLSEEYPD